MWLFLITIPFWTNLLIRTFAINEVIRNEGLVNSFLIWLGVIDASRWRSSTPIRRCLIGMAYVYLPLMVLPLFAAIDRFDMKLLEAGYDLYASRMQVLRRVILPIVKPGIIAGSILVFVPSLGRLCHAARSGWRQEHDDRQFHRIAVRSGPQLAPGGGDCR